MDWFDRLICRLFDWLTGDGGDTDARGRGQPRAQ